MENSNDLTPQEVADILKIAKTTVYEMIKRKELNSYRLGNKIRIESFEVEEYKRKKLGKTISEPEKKQPAPTPEFTDSSNFQGFVICGQDILLDILSRYIEIPLIFKIFKPNLSLFFNQLLWLKKFLLFIFILLLKYNFEANCLTRILKHFLMDIFIFHLHNKIFSLFIYCPP